MAESTVLRLALTSELNVVSLAVSTLLITLLIKAGSSMSTLV